MILKKKVAEAESAGDEEPRASRVSKLWSDGLGTFATRAIQIIIVVGIVAAAAYLLSVLSLVMIPIVLAIILASTLWPLTRRMRAAGIPRALIAAGELIGIVAALGVIGWLITWAVLAQWDDLASQARQGFDQLMDWVHTLPFVPSDDELQRMLSESMQHLQDFNIGSGAAAGVSAVAAFFTGFVLMVIILFFFLKDGPEIWRFLLRPFAGRGLARARRAGAETVKTLGAYVRGTAIVAFADAVGIGIGLVILQVPLALPLSVLVFLLAFIPLVGAVLAGVLAALVAFVANGPVVALIVIGVVVLVNRLEGDLLHPLVLGRALKLHPLVILIALTVGTVVSGVLGAVLAVPIAAVIWSIIQVWDGPNLPARRFRPRPDERADRDPKSSRRFGRGKGQKSEDTAAKGVESGASK